MKQLPSTSWLLSALVLLCGCGGYSGSPYTHPSTPPSDPPPQPNIAGNWQLSTRSKAGVPPLTIAGSINQSGSSLSGAVHVDGWSCFDQQTTIDLTGTLTNLGVSGGRSSEKLDKKTNLHGRQCLPELRVRWRTNHHLHRQYQRRDWIPLCPERDVCHQRWLCQRRAREPHRLQGGFNHRQLGRQLNDCGSRIYPLGYPAGSGQCQLGGQLWPHGKIHFQRSLL